MALQEVKVSTRIVGGVETKADPKGVPATRLLDLQNGVFTKAGSVSKRFGARALGLTIEGGGGSVVTSPRALATRGDELVLFTDGPSYSYRATSDTWSLIGSSISATATERPIARTGTAQTAGDMATNGGVTAIAWIDSRGGVWWATIEAATGRLLRAPAQLDAVGERPRVVAVGSVLHVYYASAALGRVSVAVINPSSPTATVTATPLVIDLSTTNPSYDVCPTTYDSGNPALIAWVQAASAGIRLSYIHASGVLGSVTTGLPTATSLTDAEATSATAAATLLTGAIAVAFEASYGTKTGLYVGVQWTRAASVSTRMLTYAFAAVQAFELDPANTCSGLAMAFQGDLVSTEHVMWAAGSVAGAISRDYRIVSGYFGSAGTFDRSGSQRGMTLASRMVADGATSVLAYGAHAVTNFPMAACMRWSIQGGAIDQICIARSLSGSAVGLPTSSTLPSFHVDASDARIHSTLLPYHVGVADRPGTYAETGLAQVSIDTDDDQAWQSTQLGRCLYLGGANPLQYDGSRWAEIGFHYAPDDIAAPTAATGTGALSSTGAYSYVAVYEEVNAQGEVDRGPASIPVAYTLVATENEITLVIPTCRLTGRGHVRIGVYRSLTGDSTVYYRCSSLDPSASGANGFVANSTSVDTVSFLDRMSDDTLATKEKLYTVGGILSNDPPSFGRAMAGGKGRLFFSDPNDPNLVRYSQQLADGYGAEVSDALATRLDPNGGDVTGVAVLDDAVIVFKERALFMIAGPGPNANPDADASAGFSEPMLITSDVGCARPVSVGVTPVGIMFQTAKGIYLLGRDHQVSYVGAPVEAYNAQTVRKTIVLPDRTQVLFICDSGRTLLYDYLFEQWSTFTNFAGLSAAVVDGSLYYLRTDGRVFVESTSSYLDDNAQIPLRIETAWYRLSDALQGLQHLYHLHALGERKSAHQLVMQYQIDYVNHWSAPVTLDARVDDGTAYGDGAYGDGPYGGTASSAYQWRWHLGQPCMAIRFRFYDVEDYGVAGASYELTELLLTGGVKANSMRPFAAGRTA